MNRSAASAGRGHRPSRTTSIAPGMSRKRARVIATPNSATVGVIVRDVSITADPAARRVGRRRSIPAGSRTCRRSPAVPSHAVETFLVEGWQIHGARGPGRSRRSCQGRRRTTPTNGLVDASGVHSSWITSATVPRVSSSAIARYRIALRGSTGETPSTSRRPSSSGATTRSWGRAAGLTLGPSSLDAPARWWPLPSSSSVRWR